MNPFSMLSVAAAGLSLLLGVWLFIGGLSNQDLQGKWQAQQQELMNHQQELATQQQTLQVQQQKIQSGRSLGEQVGPAVLKDLGAVVVQNKNEKVRGLLSRYGVSVQEGSPPPKAGSPSPATTPNLRP